MLAEKLHAQLGEVASEHKPHRRQDEVSFAKEPSVQTESQMMMSFGEQSQVDPLKASFNQSNQSLALLTGSLILDGGQQRISSLLNSIHEH